MMTEKVMGFHAVRALLTSSLRQVHEVYLMSDRADKRMQELEQLAHEKHVKTIKLSKHAFDKRFEGRNQGVVAIADARKKFNEKMLPELLEGSQPPLLILILDGVTDPHNLGACLRTCDATGVDFVIVPKDKSAGVTDVVAKVASGALDTIPLVEVTNLARTIKTLKEYGVWLYGAAGEAHETLYQHDFTGNIALCMGAEGHGLRRLTRESCDGLFSIPMLGSVESLNVSVATGVSLYEVTRQRASKA